MCYLILQELPGLQYNDPVLARAQNRLRHSIMTCSIYQVITPMNHGLGTLRQLWLAFFHDTGAMIKDRKPRYRPVNVDASCNCPLRIFESTDDRPITTKVSQGHVPLKRISSRSVEVLSFENDTGIPPSMWPSVISALKV